jgi:hypothetical protein
LDKGREKITQDELQAIEREKVCVPFIYLPILEREKVCVSFIIQFCTIIWFIFLFFCLLVNTAFLFWLYFDILQKGTKNLD